MSRKVALLVVLLVGSSSCKVANLDHCAWRGEHVFCAANFEDAPFCSPCTAVEQSNGCVAEPPSAKECPEFEAPATSSSSGGDTETDTDTGAGSSSSSSSSTATDDATM